MCVKIDDFHAFVYGVLLYIQGVYDLFKHKKLSPKAFYTFISVIVTIKK